MPVIDKPISKVIYEILKRYDVPTTGVFESQNNPWDVMIKVELQDKEALMFSIPIHHSKEEVLKHIVKTCKKQYEVKMPTPFK